MKKVLLVLFGLLAVVQWTYAQTLVSGGIYSNASWTLSNSPYLVTGNIVVFPGVTLSIEPGVEVRVLDNASVAPGIYIESRGTINMTGLPGLPIRFHADSAVTTVGAWQGFKVNNAQGGAINFDYVEVSNANSTFTYTGAPPQYISLHGCSFKYNYYGIESALSLTLDSCFFFGNYSAVAGWSIFEITRCTFDSNGAALPIYASSLLVDSCTFSNNSAAIYLNSIPITGMTITNSTFNNNGYALNNPGNGTISNCTFTQNTTAIEGCINAQIIDSYFYENDKAVQLGFGSTISNCEITNNNVGVGLGPLSFGQPAPNVLDNRICQNDSFNVENNTDLNLFLATNCFCESDSSVIEDKILDGYDDITRGLISYAIYDTTCSTVLRLIDKTDPSIIEDLDNFFLNVFPNPASNSLTILHSSENASVNLMDQFGKMVVSCSLKPAQSVLDVSNLPRGVYFIQCLDGPKAYSGKIFLQ